MNQTKRVMTQAYTYDKPQDLRRVFIRLFITLVFGQYTYL